MRLILFSLQIDESSISFTIDRVIVRVSPPLDPGKFNGNAKKRLTLGSLEADQLGILAFPGAVKRPHPGIVQRVEMQSVHGADRFSTAVHLLIKHTTINSAGYFLFGCFQLSSSPNDSNSLDTYIYINVQSIENIEVSSKKSRFTLNSPPHPSSNSNKYPSMAGPL